MALEDLVKFLTKIAPFILSCVFEIIALCDGWKVFKHVSNLVSVFVIISTLLTVVIISLHVFGELKRDYQEKTCFRKLELLLEGILMLFIVIAVVVYIAMVEGQTAIACTAVGMTLHAILGCRKLSSLAMNKWFE